MADTYTYGDPRYGQQASVGRSPMAYVPPVAAMGLGARSLYRAAKPPSDEMIARAYAQRDAATRMWAEKVAGTSGRQRKRWAAAATKARKVADARMKATNAAVPKMRTPAARLKRAGVGGALVVGGALTVAGMRRKDRDAQVW